MKIVQVYETSDGVRHDTLAAAERHADERYGGAVTAMAHKLVQQTRYNAMCRAIEESLPDFAQIIALKTDTFLESSDKTERI